MPPTNLSNALEKARMQIDAELDDVLPDEGAYPPEIHRAMRYSLFAGGKRLRPALTLWACELCGGTIDKALPAACALEMIHTYSLIHDDLPAIDNDDLRRGQPTCHKQFGQATAILAGDALLTHAFLIIAEHTDDPALMYTFVTEIGRASGTGGIIGGQVVDIMTSAEEATDQQHDKAAELLEYIHKHKTVPPFVAAVRCGAAAAKASKPDIDTLTSYARDIGLAFQISDDILDVEGTAGELGKTPGKDAAAAKLTYPAVFGVEQARTEADELVNSACDAIKRFGTRAELLTQLARFICERKN